MTSLRIPHFRTKPGESYDSARARWQTRMNEYQDAVVMNDCAAHSTGFCKRRHHIYWAFHGMTAMEAAQVLAEDEHE